MNFWKKYIKWIFFSQNFNWSLRPYRCHYFHEIWKESVLPNAKCSQILKMVNIFYWILPDSTNMPNQSKISKSLSFWMIGLKFCMCLLLMHTNIAILSKSYSSLPIFLYFAKCKRNLQRLTNFCLKSKSYRRILTKF